MFKSISYLRFDHYGAVDDRLDNDYNFHYWNNNMSSHFFHASSIVLYIQEV